MKSFKKVTFICMLSCITFGIVPSIVYAPTAVEYGLIIYDNLITGGQFSSYSALQHNQCNHIANGVTKSPINGKSLNPLCQLCMGLQDDQAINTAYASIPLTALGGTTNTYVSVCVTPTTQALPATGSTFDSDFSMLCSTRGGTYFTTGPAVSIPSSGVPYLVFCDFTPP